MKNNNFSSTNKLLWFSALTILFFYAIGVFSHKHILLDGSRITYIVIQDQTFRRDVPQTRYASTILQTPLVVFQKVFGNEAAVKYGSYILGYSHWALIAFSALLTLGFAIKRKQTWLALLVILATCICVAPGITFLHSYAIDTYSYSWLLFSCYFFLKGHVRIICSVILIILLTLSYETAIIILCLTAITSFLFFRKNKLEWLLIASSIIGSIHQIVMAAITVPDGARLSFWDAFARGLQNPFLIWTLVTVLYFCINLIFRLPRLVKASAYGAIVFSGASLITGIFGWPFSVQGNEAIIYSFTARAWIVLSVFPLFCCAGFLLLKNKVYQVTKMDLVFVSLIVGLCSVYELKQALVWMEATQELLNYKKNTVGCSVLSKEQTEELEGKGMDHNHLIWYQIILGRESDLTSFVFPSPLTRDSRSPDFDSCAAMTLNQIHIPHPGIFIHFPAHENAAYKIIR